MKILIPVEEAYESEKSKVGHLDSSEIACIYDAQNNKTEFVPLTEISAKKGNLSVEMKRQGIDVLICSSIPSLAFDLFSLMGVSILQSTSGTISDNIAAFTNSSLSPLTASSELNMSGCASTSCSSCSSAC